MARRGWLKNQRIFHGFNPASRNRHRLRGRLSGGIAMWSVTLSTSPITFDHDTSSGGNLTARALETPTPDAGDVAHTRRKSNPARRCRMSWRLYSPMSVSAAPCTMLVGGVVARTCSSGEYALAESGIECLSYHGELNSDVRAANLQKFREGAFREERVPASSMTR